MLLLSHDRRLTVSAAAPLPLSALFSDLQQDEPYPFLDGAQVLGPTAGVDGLCVASLIPSLWTGVGWRYLGNEGVWKLVLRYRIEAVPFLS